MFSSCVSISDIRLKLLNVMLIRALNVCTVGAPFKASAGVAGLITEKDFKEYSTSLCQELAAVCIARGSSVV